MTNINFKEFFNDIREFLKKFEKNKNNREGIASLNYALEEMEAIFEETKDIRKLWIIHNLYHKYRNMVIEEVRKMARNGTPSLDELNLIVDLMELFKKHKFQDEDRDFKDAYDKSVALRKIIAEKTEPETISRKVVYKKIIAAGRDAKIASQISGYTPKDG